MTASVEPTSASCDHDHEVATTSGPETPDHASGPPRWTGPIVVGAMAVVGVAYTAWQDPNADGVFPQCPTRELFGFDCPGCGGLRAVHALTRGDVLAAFDHNILVPVVLPLLVVGWVIWLLRSMGRPAPTIPRPSRPALAVLAVFLLAFTVVRNIGGVGLFEYLHSTT